MITLGAEGVDVFLSPDLCAIRRRAYTIRQECCGDAEQWSDDQGGITTLSPYVCIEVIEAVRSRTGDYRDWGSSPILPTGRASAQLQSTPLFAGPPIPLSAATEPVAETPLCLVSL